MILLSPSKGQDFAPIDLPVSASEPAFAKEADRLSALLGQYNPADLAKLMALSPALAEAILAALDRGHSPAEVAGDHGLAEAVVRGLG